MRCWTFGAALAVLAFGVDALDNCDSNVLVKAYEGLNVNTQLVSCMTKNNFSAALDGSVDLTTVNAATAPEQVKTICASDDCKTILSALVGSANFNLTNCIVGNNIVLMTEITNLQATCTTISSTPSTTAPASTTAAPTPAPASTTAAPTQAPATTAPSTTAPATTAPTEAPTQAPSTTAPTSTTAAPTVAPPAPTGDNSQQQQTFSTLNSDSGSAGGVSPGKFCK